MENSKLPYILEETDDYAVVFKPPRMHSAPLSKKESRFAEPTLFEWYAKSSPPVFDLMHRLDYETHGLILLAKTQKSFEHFKTIQDKGEFVKEYSAICAADGRPVNVDGFPPPPEGEPRIIMSYFRPFGPGRKLVRPVTDTAKKNKEIATDKGGFYRTEIIGADGDAFTLRIKRGFRHQIRCHLSWIGCPILNDSLYNAQAQTNEDALAASACRTNALEESACETRTLEASLLALRAHALFFTEPASGKPRECRIAALDF